MQLNKNWFIEKNSDYEYQKYMVLAYIQEIKKQYEQNIIQPHIDNLTELYNDGLGCIRNMEYVQEMNSGFCNSKI